MGILCLFLTTNCVIMKITIGLNKIRNVKTNWLKQTSTNNHIPKYDVNSRLAGGVDPACSVGERSTLWQSTKTSEKEY